MTSEGVKPNRNSHEPLINSEKELNTDNTDTAGVYTQCRSGNVAHTHLCLQMDVKIRLLVSPNRE